MIHLIIGTKAQLIKMAPVLQELRRRDAIFNFIDAGQHARTTEEIIRQLDLPRPDVYLRNSQENISTLFQALTWVLSALFQIIFRPQAIFKAVFKCQSGICLIHGDTLTTLISLFYAKRCGIKVAHIESGLRSYRIFDPFPEEMIRRIAMRYSDILYAPSEWAVSNLQKMGYSDKTVFIDGNTIMDTIAYAKNHLETAIIPNKPYIVVTIHRVETLYSKARLVMIINLLKRIAQSREVLFVLHEPTQKKLKKFQLDSLLQEVSNLRMLPLQPYLSFIKLISDADYIITDGGSIQEESYFLNVPCLIMRSSTERMEGINQNAHLARFDEKAIQEFFDKMPNLRQKPYSGVQKPSKKVVDDVLKRQEITICSLGKIKKFFAPFKGSRRYWADRYESGGNSGAGSYGNLAHYKADFLNRFVAQNNIQSVIELGCGDGNQLSLAGYPHYLGFDISSKAIEMCRERFQSDSTKTFKLMNEYNGEKADAALSLDVIFHLIEDDIYQKYMETLFNSGRDFVIIYASNTAKRKFVQLPHVKHRRFTDWVNAKAKSWQLIKHIPDQPPFPENTKDKFSVDFYVFSIRTSDPLC